MAIILPEKPNVSRIILSRRIFKECGASKKYFSNAIIANVIHHGTVVFNICVNRYRCVVKIDVIIKLLYTIS
ncbi:MAG: type II toxin-antitoxin system HigB family toxin [Anaerolineales bacterium]|nr:type II toxin-antitoxin system HigB family toxin [Anaerolineales bacterium]